MNGRLGKQSVQQRQPLAPPPPQQPAQQIVSQPIETSIYRPRPTSAIPTQPAMNNFSIRGRSATAAPTPGGYTIKGESGPTLLLVTGLDPGANDDDLKVRKGKKRKQCLSLFLIQTTFTTVCF